MTIYKQLIDEQRKKMFIKNMDEETMNLFTKRHILAIPFDTLENAEKIDLSYVNNKNNN